QDRVCQTGAGSGQDRRRVLQDREDARVEQPGEPARRIEEVDGVSRRRRVDDEQIVAALPGEPVDLLYRPVLGRSGEGAREVLVEAVLEDGARVRGGRREGEDELVERPLDVEQERV